VRLLVWRRLEELGLFALRLGDDVGLERHLLGELGDESRVVEQRLPVT
jgi:hypothetical protein